MVALRRLVSRSGPALFWTGLVLLWQALHGAPFFPRALVPSPLAIGQALVTDAPLIFKHLGSTLTLTAQGLFWGLAAGLLTALFLDRFPKTRPYVEPFLTLSQTIPPFMIYPLLLLNFGFGPAPRIIIAALVCYFPVAVSFYQGLKETDPDYLELLRNLKAPAWSTYRWLKIPQALPALAGGIKIAASYGVVGVVFGEMMGGPLEGIGFYMLRKIDGFQPASVYAALVLVSLTTLLLLAIVSLWEKKLMEKRKRSSE